MEDIKNNAAEFVGLKGFYGRRQMKLYFAMKEHGDIPHNDCLLYMNIGRMIEELAKDWRRFDSSAAKIAINKYALELMEDMCRVYDGKAVQDCIQMLRAEQRISGIAKKLEGKSYDERLGILTAVAYGASLEEAMGEEDSK